MQFQLQITQSGFTLDVLRVYMMNSLFIFFISSLLMMNPEISRGNLPIVLISSYLLIEEAGE
jgi:hypothetical protein